MMWQNSCILQVRVGFPTVPSFSAFTRLFALSTVNGDPVMFQKELGAGDIKLRRT